MAIIAQNMNQKPRYKLTEVGMIPEDWKVTKLGEVADIKTGPFGSALHEKDYVDDGTPIITVEHLGERGVVYENVPMVSEDDRKRLKAYSLLEGDIVFSRVGSVDRNSLVKERESGWLFSGRLLRIRLKHQGVDSAFLSYYFNQESTKQRIRSVAVGQTMASLNTQILKSINIAFPPTKSEQRAITTVLSDIDALITSLDKLITKKRDIKQATMQQLLTGKTRLPGFSGEWDVKKLEDECELITKGTTPTSLGKDFLTQGINFVKVESLTEEGDIIQDKLAFIDEETYNLLKRSQLKNKDILFSIAGALGRTAIVKQDILPANTNQALALIRLKDRSCLYHIFLAKYLTSPEITKHIGLINVQAAQANLSLEDVRHFVIKVPEIPEQQAIATILSDMDAEIAALEHRREKTRMLKQGMMQELLTGKTRLV